MHAHWAAARSRRRWHDSGIWQVDLLWSLHLAIAWMVIAALGLALWHLGLLASPSPAPVKPSWVV